MKTFVIILSFTSWDECWNFVHAHDIGDAAEFTCAEYIDPAEESLAPTTSIRPKARPEGN